jgi:spermidine synthase
MACTEDEIPAFRPIDAQALDTHYYNTEIHTAALAQPEFVRKRLAALD